MQTFLPYADLERTASILDRERLGKQRVETMQIMDALVNNQGWVNHPATRMWRGYEGALFVYQTVIVAEWKRRGLLKRGREYEDNCLEKTRQMLWEQDTDSDTMPPWLGDKAFHMGHQSNLLRKDPLHYEYLVEPATPPDMPYLWPQLLDNGGYILHEGTPVS